jgi:diguanylate cyclase (GGDEF)-like protein/PAS domain S-box-containing protein
MKTKHPLLSAQNVMKRSIFSSLRARLLLLMLVAITPWVAAMSYQLWAARQHAIDDAVGDALDLARAVASTQSQAVSNAYSLSQILSALPEIREGNPEICRQRLVEIHRNARDFANLVVTDARGKMVCAAKGAGANDFSERDWYKLALKEKHFVTGRFVIGKLQGLPILPTALPLLNQQGQVERIVLVPINVAWLERLLKQARIGEDATITVLDKHAVIMARQPADPQRIGKTSLFKPLVDAITSGKEEGIGEAINAKGLPILFAYARLPGASEVGGNVYVSVNIPKQRVLAQAYRNFSVNLALLGTLTLFAVFGIWLFTEVFVLRKVRALIIAAERIATGDFSARAALQGGGGSELGELACAFDDMAASIEQNFQQTIGVMEVAPEAIIISDEQGRIIRANAQTQKLFGYSADELLGQQIELLVSEGLRKDYVDYRRDYVYSPIARDTDKHTDVFASRKDGAKFPVDVRRGTLNTAQGLLVITAVRDISERKQFEAQIIQQATHDALTDLPNRAFFRELLVRAMAQAERSEKLLAVMFLDLDGFKNVNDTLGHEAGDALLGVIAGRLVGTLRKDDVVARQGGDEFTILLQGINVYQDIVQIAEKILLAIALPVQYETHEMHITASIGITIFPFDDVEPENLLRNADTAMYEAKQAGKNDFRFYTAEMNSAIRERMELEQGLRRALQENQFELYYQPQAGIQHLETIGMEALLRWHHPELGMIPPAKFIPVAEESGLIVPIGEWVLRTACRQISAWRAAGLPAIKVAVNLSARQFREAKLLDTIQSILEECGLSAHAEALELELTESMVMHHVEEHVITLNKLHSMGVQISIDDFGTGYSSLSYLKRFPINTLKIDQSFVQRITEETEDEAIASAIVMLGHSLKFKVIAEGVETAEQLALLRSIGCDEIQGYYLSRPLPLAEMEAFLRKSPVKLAAVS